MDWNPGRPDRESQVFCGVETKRQEWYCECSGDRYLDSVCRSRGYITRNDGHVSWETERKPGLATMVSDPGEVEGSATERLHFQRIFFFFK